MPTLTIDVPHSLGQEEATGRLKGHFASVKEQFGQQVSDLEETWNDHKLSFRFATYGVQVQGTVTSGSSEVRVAAKLPLAAMMFRSTIEQTIRDELEKMLG